MNAEKVLADTFARHEYLTPDAEPLLADIHRRIHARSHRRHMNYLTAVGAAATVAAIAFGATTVFGGGTRTTSPPPSTPSSVTTAADKVSRFGTPIGGRFVDRDHGFVVLMRCPYSVLTPPAPNDPRLDEPCPVVLEATSDGGRTFREHVLPSSTSAIFQLYVFDAKHLAVVQQTEVIEVGHHDVNVTAGRWISSDGGATWTPVDLQPGAEVTQIPPGAQVVTVGGNLERPAVLTPDGVLHPLAKLSVSTLALDVPLGTVSEAAGLNFAYLNTDASNQYSGGDLWISRDHGRSWQNSRLPSGVFAARVLGSDGHWMYALAETSNPLRRQVTIASNDGGQTWQALALPALPAAKGFVMPGYAVAASGGLVYDDGAHLWHASGVGRFVRIPDTVTTQYLLGIGPAMVGIRVANDGTITLATSTDGAHWRNATIH